MVSAVIVYDRLGHDAVAILHPWLKAGNTHIMESIDHPSSGNGLIEARPFARIEIRSVIRSHLNIGKSPVT